MEHNIEKLPFTITQVYSKPNGDPCNKQTLTLSTDRNPDWLFIPTYVCLVSDGGCGKKIPAVPRSV